MDFEFLFAIFSCGLSITLQAASNLMAAKRAGGVVQPEAPTWPKDTTWTFSNGVWIPNPPVLIADQEISDSAIALARDDLQSSVILLEQQLVKFTSVVSVLLLITSLALVVWPAVRWLYNVVDTFGSCEVQALNFLGGFDPDRYLDEKVPSISTNHLSEEYNIADGGYYSKQDQDSSENSAARLAEGSIIIAQQQDKSDERFEQLQESHEQLLEAYNALGEIHQELTQELISLRDQHEELKSKVSKMEEGASQRELAFSNSIDTLRKELFELIAILKEDPQHCGDKDSSQAVSSPPVFSSPVSPSPVLPSSNPASPDPLPARIDRLPSASLPTDDEELELVVLSHAADNHEQWCPMMATGSLFVQPSEQGALTTAAPQQIQSPTFEASQVHIPTGTAEMVPSSTVRPHAIEPLAPSYVSKAPRNRIALSQSRWAPADASPTLLCPADVPTEPEIIDSVTSASPVKALKVEHCLSKSCWASTAAIVTSSVPIDVHAEPKAQLSLPSSCLAPPAEALPEKTVMKSSGWAGFDGYGSNQKVIFPPSVPIHRPTDLHDFQSGYVPGAVIEDLPSRHAPVPMSTQTSTIPGSSAVPGRNVTPSSIPTGPSANAPTRRPDQSQPGRGSTISTNDGASASSPTLQLDTAFSKEQARQYRRTGRISEIPPCKREAEDGECRIRHMRNPARRCLFRHAGEG